MMTAPAMNSACIDGAFLLGWAFCNAGVPPDVGHVRAVDVVLDDDRQARERAASSLIDLGCRRQRAVLVQENECVQVLQLFGAFDRGFCDGGCRYLLSADGGDDFRQPTTGSTGPLPGSHARMKEAPR